VTSCAVLCFASSRSCLVLSCSVLSVADHAAAMGADLSAEPGPQGILQSVSGLGLGRPEDGESAADPQMASLCHLASEVCLHACMYVCGTRSAPFPHAGCLSVSCAKVAAAVARLSRGLTVAVRTPKISFKDFRVGDVMLFIPTSEARKKWIAFHTGAPHRFLSDVSPP
jgi:hypothetical protein